MKEWCNLRSLGAFGLDREHVLANVEWGKAFGSLATQYPCMQARNIGSPFCFCGEGKKVELRTCPFSERVELHKHTFVCRGEQSDERPLIWLFCIQSIEV